MNVATLIARYGRTVTLSQESVSGSIDDEGGFTAGAASTSSITMSIQNITGDEALRLPDGLRNKKVMKGYTTTELSNGSEPDSILPYKIIDGDQTYEVNDVQYYEASPLNIAPYYRCTLVRVNPT